MGIVCKTRLSSYLRSIWLVFLLLPSICFTQDLGKQLLKKLGDKAKQETTAFVSKAASKEIAKALGFTPLQTLSRGDRSLSASQRRTAQSAESLFYGHAYTTPPAESTRVERSASGSNPAIRRYEVLTEADIAAIERDFQPLLDRIQREIDNPGTSGIISIPPGQKRLVHFQGYCLDKGIAAPQTQEGFQLLPISNLLPGDALPFYGGLLQYGQASGRTNEVQGLIWRLVHGVNPEHEPTALYPNETQILNEAVPGGATAFYNYLRGKYQQSKTSLQAVYQKEGRELVQDVVNRYVNPAFGGSGISVNLYRQDLNGSAQIEDYLNRLAQLPVEGKVENGSEYTLLANQVAARSVSTYDVRGLSIEIANGSGLSYYYDPLEYIALSTRMTQPVGHYPKELEEDPELTSSVEQVLQFLEDNEQTLEYVGYALDAFLIVAGPGGVAVRLGVRAAAKYLAKHPEKLKTLRDAFFKTKGKKWEGEVLPNPSKGKWVDDNGKILWPTNNGFSGTPMITKLKAGAKFDRYGSSTGKFASPLGTPANQRSLSPGMVSKPLTKYEVIKPFDVQSGKIAPWFGESGGGVQYKFDKSVKDLLLEGYIKEIK
jgi:Tuberculosis necrotizing toxin